MFKDPEFQEELKKRKWEVEFIGGEELQTLARDVVNQPPEINGVVEKVAGKVSS